MEKAVKHILIVEDQLMPQRLFELYVEQEPEFRLVRSIENADLAELICAQNQVDLILMDVCTAMGASGLEAAARIKKKYPRIRIVIVTSMPEHSFLEKARSAGADSFWYKESAEMPILEVMKRTLAGESVYPDRVPEVQIGLAASGEFTPRELEILRLLMEGLTTRESGAELGISEGNVTQRVKELLSKTGFRTRTGLAVAVQKSGLILPDY